jgi:hypothetical protein
MLHELAQAIAIVGADALQWFPWLDPGTCKIDIVSGLFLCKTYTSLLVWPTAGSCLSYFPASTSFFAVQRPHLLRRSHKKSKNQKISKVKKG